MAYQAKDFIQVRQGLLFAVVADGVEQGKVLCFLRYACFNGLWRKVNTDEANAFLKRHQPEFLHYSSRLDTHLHAVSVSLITRHYRPGIALNRLLRQDAEDAVIRDLQGLCGLLEVNQIDLNHFGVTGSILVGMQNHASDMDLVCYHRDTFHQTRHIIQALIAKDQCQVLNEDDWLSSYQRRACDFALDDYIWHEQRKYNKAIFNQRKFDLSLSAPKATHNFRQFRKAGFVRIQADVIDDSLGFDYPAQFGLAHPEIQSVLCFTATYTGQAKVGERIDVAGQLETDDLGLQRIVVGSSREAIGEYIRVLR